MAGMAASRAGPGVAKAVALACCVIWPASVPALARDLTAGERASLAEAVGKFEIATRDGDGERLVAALPPRLLDDMAKQGGMTAAEVRPMVAEYFRKAKRDGLDVTPTLDLPHARFASLGDGTPYVLIPSQAVAVKAAHAIESRFTTLALIDDGKWFLTAASTPERVTAFLRAYPGFSGVDFGTETFKAKP